MTAPTTPSEAVQNETTTDEPERFQDDASDSVADLPAVEESPELPLAVANSATLRSPEVTEIELDIDVLLTEVEEAPPTSVRPPPPQRTSVAPAPPSARPPTVRPAGTPLPPSASGLPRPHSSRALPSAPPMLKHPLHGSSAQAVVPSVASNIALGAAVGTNVEIARLNEELNSLRSRLSAQRQEARTSQKNAERLRNEIAELKAKAASTESAQILIQERAHHQEVLVALKSKHTTELAALRESLKQTTNEASPPDRHEITRLRQELTELKQELTELKQLNQELQSHSGGSEPRSAAGGDDLTRIRGVGPAFAKLLHQHGITTFSQVAAWTSEDINKLAPLIKSTAPRMKKWVKSAETLMGNARIP